MKLTTYPTLRQALFWCCTALAGLQMSTSAAILTNRYSFTTDASDSVGGQNGALSNATISAGQVILGSPQPTPSSDPTGQYVDLPDNLVSNYTALTMEVWVTPTHDDATGGAFWNRIWDFGNSDGNGVPGFMWLRSGNSTTGIRADIVPPAAGSTVNGPVIANGVESHIVFTSDGASQRGRIYVNGVLAGVNDTFTSTPAAMGSTTNNWLGRSQFGGDSYFNGSINEFRIYNGELNPLEAAANYQAGPDLTGASAGTVTNLQLQISSPFAVNATVPSVVLAKASALNSAIDIANSAVAVTYTSANTNIARVDTKGFVTGVAAGTVNIVASYASVSATQSVQVISVPTTMKHRYSFTNDVTDSVGGADGSLSGNATISNGQVVLDGVPGSYVDLPPYLIHPTNIVNSAVTFEGWVTCYPVNGAWTRLFDFGNISGGNGANYVFFAPNTGANGGNARVAVSDANPGYTGEDGVNVGNILGQTNAHVVVVYNPNPARKFLGLYINGSLVGSATTSKQLSTVNNAFSFLGRSTYSGDSWLNGAINEFRIYDGELDRFQIAASAQSGPDTPNFNVGTFQSFVLSTGPATMAVDQLRQLTRVVLNFSAATNINVLGDAGLTLTSSDTNVLTITSPAGLMQSLKLGSATVTATYKYVNGATTNTYTQSTVVQVVIPPGQLVHRYSFNESSGSVVHDSVGTANGVIDAFTTGSTNSIWAGGQLTINTSTNIGAGDTYVNLPAGIVSSLASNATFEVWATDASSAGWQRLFDFGSVPASPTNAAQPNIFLTRGPGNTTPRYDWVNGNVNANAVWANNVQAHFVVLHDGTDGSAKLYRDGVLVASSATQNLPLSSINDIYCFLGRSIYSAPISLPGGYFDPYLIGSFNEFRIYSGLLTEAEITRQFALGPDQVIANVPLSFNISGSALTFSWPLYGAHFALESSPTLGTGAVWTSVAGNVTQSGTNYQMTAPVSGSARFFRLKR